MPDGGRIVALPVADNQFVRKGDLLMVIDPTNYRIAVSLAEAAVEQAQATAKNAGREAEREFAICQKSHGRHIELVIHIHGVCGTELAASSPVSLNPFSARRAALRTTVDGSTSNSLEIIRTSVSRSVTSKSNSSSDAAAASLSCCIRVEKSAAS
jgi:multidrug resistance efflux pump